MSHDEDQVARVVCILGGAGFQPLTQPIIIGGLPFEFAATLAKDASLELIVVVDTVLESEPASLRARIEGLARALDLVSSRRTLTVVLVGPPPGPALARELKRVARVLPVATGGQAQGEPTVEQALAVLLPLDPSVAGTEALSSWPNVRDELRARYPAAELDPVFKAVARGSRQVQNALHDLLLEPLDRG